MSQGDSCEAAYARSDLLERHREVTKAWGAVRDRTGEGWMRSAPPSS